MGVFPEGISHTESQLTELKTGTARIALEVSARGKANVVIVPSGLNYINRHRFRSQVLIEFGEPIEIDDEWVRRYRDDEEAAVRDLTDDLAQALVEVTLNSPDWRTLRFAQAARRLYKPTKSRLTPKQYIELNKRFVEGYMESQDDPELLAFRDDVEEYEAHLQLLGLKDYQLRKPVELWPAFRRILLRALRMLILLPLAIPGAILHLPVGWVAASIGERFSYEMDDVATLKVFATVALLPLIYVLIGFWVGSEFGWAWGVATVAGLTVSFSATIALLEAEAGLYRSAMSLFKLARLREEVEELREQRAQLVAKVRDLANRLSDPDVPRIFTDEDFSS
jgi:glycerol-3-phosphate O-acyltransferase/dihydroxyacetone phosphate acyltransferase